MLTGESLPERPLTAGLAGLVGAILANVGFALLGSAGEQASVASVLGSGLGVGGAGPPAVSLAIAALVAIAVYADLGRDREGAQRRFLLAMGGLVAFSAGGSQVGLAIGPLVPIFTEVGVPVWALLVGGGVGLLAGSWTGAPRMIKAISQDYASMGPRRSISALIPSFAIAQTAVAFGIPVSFNEIIVSAIVGAGYAAGDAGVSREKMGYTVLAWIGSLVGAFALGYGVYSAVDLAV
jgi:PiT family inorganic phosphate transporter